MSTREIDGDQKRDELNRRPGPEGSENRKVAHILRLMIETVVRHRAVDQESCESRTNGAGQAGY